MAYRSGRPIIGFTRRFLPFTVVFHIILALVRLVGWGMLGIRIRGRERLRGVPAAVLVSNHTLLLDPGIIAHAIRPRRTYFTMLEETALIPGLGTFVRLLGGIPIPEGPQAMRLLEAAAREAVEGLGFIHFFPEGECYRDSQTLRPFHPGAFLLACRLGLPVIPVTTVLHERRIRGAVRVGGWTLRVPPRVTIVIGAPLLPPLALVSARPDAGGPAGLKRAAHELAERTRAVMQDTIDGAGGCKTMDRGQMPRLVKHPDPAAERRVVGAR
jgi:1-acyl-sn-glycerol-3-phosphate acyltransferase